MFNVIGRRPANIIGREVAGVITKKSAEFVPAKLTVNVAPEVSKMAANRLDVTLRHGGHEIVKSNKHSILDLVI